MRRCARRSVGWGWARSRCRSSGARAPAGGEAAQRTAVEQVRAALAERFGDGISHRRVEFVGPQVSGDLLWNGIQAMVHSVVAILAYIWFRFGWQFAIGAILALVHDAATTLGRFALFGLEFNLTTVAALLTIIGYSISDTLMIYDRVLENLRRASRPCRCPH